MAPPSQLGQARRRRRPVRAQTGRPCRARRGPPCEPRRRRAWLPCADRARSCDRRATDARRRSQARASRAASVRRGGATREGVRHRRHPLCAERAEQRRRRRTERTVHGARALGARAEPGSRAQAHGPLVARAAARRRRDRTPFAYGARRDGARAGRMAGGADMPSGIRRRGLRSLPTRLTTSRERRVDALTAPETRALLEREGIELDLHTGTLGGRHGREIDEVLIVVRSTTKRTACDRCTRGSSRRWTSSASPTKWCS